MRQFAAGCGVVVLALMAMGLRVAIVQAAGPDEAAAPEFYTTQVKPVFQANCYRCHGGFNHRGGLNIETRAGLLKGGKDGPVLIPGDPSKSLLIRLIRHEGSTPDSTPMPPKSPKLSDADIATVTRWVQAGAIMPR